MFCRAVGSSFLKSSEILIVPEGNSAYDTSYQKYHWDMEQLLEPLRALRNIHAFSIRDTNLDEIPDTVFQSHVSILPIILKNSMEDKSQLAEQLLLLVNGSTAVEFIHKMNDRLMDYAQQFERFEPFRFEMRTGRSSQTYRHGTSSVTVPRKLNWNPFTCTPIDGGYDHSVFHSWHPVEKALNYARRVSDFEAFKKRLQRPQTIESLNVKFKLHRSVVVGCVEAQYQRIATAAANLNEFIKDEKRSGDMFAPTGENAYLGYGHAANSNMAIGLIYLDEYQKALADRDMPRDVEVRFRAYGGNHNHDSNLNKTYGSRARE